MAKYIFPLIAISILLAGCSDPVIDVSTDESQRSSIAKIRNSLSDSKRAEFIEAIKIITVNEIKRQALSVHSADGEDDDKRIRAAIHGKTADQIINQAIKIDHRLKEKASSRIVEDKYSDKDRYTVIDTTTDESRTKTIRSIKNSLTSSDSEKFEKALQLVIAYHIDFKSLPQNNIGPIIDERTKAAIHGKTADEILEEADAIRMNRDRDNFYMNMDE